MSKYPTSSSDDASSISNEPLIPKASEPKDYEAAAAALMSSYGFSGGMHPTPTQSKKKNKSARGSSKKKSDTASGNKAGQSSDVSSSNTGSKK